MELVAPKEPLEFKYKDVTFLIKPQAVDADRMEVFSAGSRDGTRLSIPKADFRRALVRCFVVGWKGVTYKGKEVPYAFETLIQSFPPHDQKGRSVIDDLCDFIIGHTDIFKEDEVEKKESRPPSTGSAPSEHSTAAGRTAEK